MSSLVPDEGLTSEWKLSHSPYTQKVFLQCEFTFWWVERFSFWLKDFPHSLHSKSFSPVWVFWCLMTYCFWLSLFHIHYIQKGFLSIMKMLMLSKSWFVAENFPHTLQAKGVFPTTNSLLTEVWHLNGSFPTFTRFLSCMNFLMNENLLLAEGISTFLTCAGLLCVWPFKCRVRDKVQRKLFIIISTFSAF